LDFRKSFVRLKGFRLKGFRKKGFRLKGFRKKGFRLKGFRLRDFRVYGENVLENQELSLSPQAVFHNYQYHFPQVIQDVVSDNYFLT